MLEVTDLLAIEDLKDKGNGYLYIIIVFECFFKHCDDAVYSNIYIYIYNNSLYL